MKIRLKSCLTASLSIVIAGGLAVPASALADDAPSADKASPEIYKLLAENDQFRVILATQKPGQRDAQHSHLVAVHYRMTDCKFRVYGPDGKAMNEGEVKAGSVLLGKAVSSHSFENIGTSDCVNLIAERK